MRTGVVAAVLLVLVGGAGVALSALGRQSSPLRLVPVDAVAAARATPVTTPSVPATRPVDGPVASPAWVGRTAARTGIPAPAVRAYGTAELRTTAEDPGCHLAWTTLAGIGWVESRQGTIGGRVLRADGRPDRPILGVALDGSGPVAAVPDGGGGYQRALGPMQIIPSTWQVWASDGDGDGALDAQDVDDAAYAAARYLCADGGDLATAAGWSAAVLGYNHSDDYVRAVYDAARTYAARTS